MQVLSTKEENDSKALQNALDTAKTKTIYYTRSNKFLEKTGKVLTLDSQNRLVMAANTRSDRQKWYLVQEGSTYHIYTKALGEGQAIDSDTQKTHRAKKGNFSGQFWHFTAQGNWYGLSNNYQGINKALDTYNAPNNYVFFKKKANNTSGTYWEKTAVSNSTD